MKATTTKNVSGPKKSRPNNEKKTDAIAMIFGRRKKKFLDNNKTREKHQKKVFNHRLEF
jgi:hypothetical protein